MNSEVPTEPLYLSFVPPLYSDEASLWVGWEEGRVWVQSGQRTWREVSVMVWEL